MTTILRTDPQGEPASIAPRRSRRRSWPVLFAPLIGVVAPIALLVVDPVVFRGEATLLGLLSPFQPFAYVGVPLACLALAAWLAFPAKLARYAGIFVGVFATSALVAGAIGAIVGPIAVLGAFVSAMFGLMALPPDMPGTATWTAADRAAEVLLLVVYGGLGVVPLFVAAAHGYEAGAARRHAEAAGVASQPMNWRLQAVVGAALFLAIPAAVQAWSASQVSAIVDGARRGDSAAVDRAADNLTRILVCREGCLSPLVFAYPRATPDAPVARDIARAYMRVTGKEVPEPPEFD